MRSRLSEEDRRSSHRTDVPHPVLAGQLWPCLLCKTLAKCEVVNPLCSPFAAGTRSGKGQEEAELWEVRALKQLFHIIDR